MSLAGRLQTTRGPLQCGPDLRCARGFIKLWQDAMNDRQGLPEACLGFGERPSRCAGCLVFIHNNKPVGSLYRGMVPCFLGGLVSRFVSVFRNAIETIARVSSGKITSVIMAFLAASYGEQNFSRYSA